MKRWMRKPVCYIQTKMLDLYENKETKAIENVTNVLKFLLKTAELSGYS